MGADAGRPFVDRAQPEHPSLLDEAHIVDQLFGIINIPNSVWIDEQGMIVRPAEAAWPGIENRSRGARLAPSETPSRMDEIMSEAAKIVSDADAYSEALRDWVRNGSASRFALSPDEVIERSGQRGDDESAAAAEFELGQHLFRSGDLPSARSHFGNAHRLQPNNWTYKRQAWSIEPGGSDDATSRFWQGPVPGSEDEWPYDGDWVADTREIGAENYYPRFRP